MYMTWGSDQKNCACGVWVSLFWEAHELGGGEGQLLAFFQEVLLGWINYRKSSIIYFEPIWGGA